MMPLEEMPVYAIEFQATIHNGVIEVPAEYRDQVQGQVRVILLADAPGPWQPDLIGHLLDHPIELAEFQPFTREALYDRK